MSELELNKIYEFAKKYQSYILFLSLLILGLILWKFDYLTQFTGEWASCVDYIKEGILYQGQPKCYHGPVNFFISYFLIEFFPHNFLQLYELLVLISSILLFLLTYKIIKKLDLKPYYILLSLLFFTLIYIAPINNNSGDSIYSTLIMLYGFYVLNFYKNIYFKYLFSSFLFTIAIFTRLNVLIPILLILIYYFISNFFFVKDKKIKIDYKNLIKALIFMFLPLVIVIAILINLYPNSISYSILTQFKVEDFSLLLKLKGFFSGISLLTQLTFLVLVILIPLYRFIKKREVYSFISLFGFILITYGTLRGHHGYFQRYYLPIFPFLIITIIQIINHIKSKHWKILFIFLTLIFSLSALKISDPYLTSPEFYELRNIVDRGFKFLPDPQGKILSDNDYFIKFTNKSYKQVDILPNKYGIDGLGASRIESLGLLGPDWKNWEISVALSNLQFEEVDLIGKKILNNEYDIIVIGPQGGNLGLGTSSPITQAMGFYALRFFNKSLEKFPYDDDFKIYCDTSFFSLKDPCPDCQHAFRIFFTNFTEKECANIAAKMVFYYYNNLEKICSLDQEIGKEYIEKVKMAFKGTNLFKESKCESNKFLVRKLYEKKIATFKEVLLILFIISIILLYYYLTIKKESKES
ncbi:MAG: hypothetical protein AABX29_09275 [Nanoarchaeota archaeon]